MLKWKAGSWFGLNDRGTMKAGNGIVGVGCLTMPFRASTAPKTSIVSINMVKLSHQKNVQGVVLFVAEESSHTGWESHVCSFSLS